MGAAKELVSTGGDNSMLNEWGGACEACSVGIKLLSVLYGTVADCWVCNSISGIQQAQFDAH